MSNDTPKITLTEQEQKDVKHLEALRARATLLKIKFHPSSKAESLSAKIDDFLRDDGKGNEADAEEKTVVAAIANGKKEYLTEAEYLKKKRVSNRKDAGKLIRCRVTCMNTNKKDWEGELFSVGSSKLGTFKKFVPFNDEPYHIPQIIFDSMKERKWSSFYSVKGQKGGTIRKSRLINEFAIEVLPPLTPDELKDLAQRQAMSGSIDE